MSDRDGNTAHPDYGGIDLPDPAEVPKPEWSWQKRRAYIYREWLDAGSHRLLNKSALASNFGVSRNTIYSDLDAIADFVDESLGQRHGAETKAVFEKAVQGLLEGGEYKDAAQVQKMMGQWLEDRGAIDKEPEQVEVEHGVDDEDLEFLDQVF